MPDFDINFGSAKELPPIVLPDEGNYTLVIDDYKIEEAQKEESRAKGFNIKLRFTFDDKELENPGKVYFNLWFHKENPFAALKFFQAVTGRDDELEGLDILDSDLFLGEKVGCFLEYENYTNKKGKKGKKLTPAGLDCWYTVTD